jgi:hypothetical protein
MAGIDTNCICATGFGMNLSCPIHGVGTSAVPPAGTGERERALEERLVWMQRAAMRACNHLGDLMGDRQAAYEITFEPAASPRPTEEIPE